MLHLHNPYPLLSPWVVRTAHRHGVPVVQTVHNYRQVCSSGLYFRDGVICQDCRGRALGVPAIVHRCYRGSRAQSALMATTLAVHRPHLAVGGPVRRAHHRRSPTTCATTASRTSGSW